MMVELTYLNELFLVAGAYCREPSDLCTGALLGYGGCPVAGNCRVEVSKHDLRRAPEIHPRVEPELEMAMIGWSRAQAERRDPGY